MRKSRGPSPSRSQGEVITPRRNKPRGSRSVCSPALSTASGRLTPVIDQFKEKNKDSFVLSPVNSRRSVLNDNTDIEEPRRKSWWKNLKDNSRDVLEMLEDDKPITNNAIEDIVDIEVLSQEKKNYTLDLPESSDNESINSIVLPQRKLFTQKENQPQKKFGQLVGTRETLAKLHKTNNTTQNDKTIAVGTKELFQKTKRTKPIFPAALLNISPNKTAADKTKENVAAVPKVQVRNIFGNRPTNKRKNIFADFIVSESEDDISEIQPKVFRFQKKVETGQSSSISKGKGHSPASSITNDMELDEWRHLPSSTMVENQLDEMLEGTPVKRARLSLRLKQSEAKETESVLSRTTNVTTMDKTKQSIKATSSNEEECEDVGAESEVEKAGNEDQEAKSKPEEAGSVAQKANSASEEAESEADETTRESDEADSEAEEANKSGVVKRNENKPVKEDESKKRLGKESDGKNTELGTTNFSTMNRTKQLNKATFLEEDESKDVGEENKVEKAEREDKEAKSKSEEAGSVAQEAETAPDEVESEAEETVRNADEDDSVAKKANKSGAVEMNENILVKEDESKKKETDKTKHHEEQILSHENKQVNESQHIEKDSGKIENPAKVVEQKNKAKEEEHVAVDAQSLVEEPENEEVQSKAEEAHNESKEAYNEAKEAESECKEAESEGKVAEREAEEAESATQEPEKEDRDAEIVAEEPENEDKEAKSKVEEAECEAEEAESADGEAESEAEEAESEAEEAESEAEEAESEAEEAESEAEEPESVAEEAESEAEEAESEAEEAESEAVEAESEAEDSESEAEKAESEIEQAVAEAESEAEKANKSEVVETNGSQPMEDGENKEIEADKSKHHEEQNLSHKNKTVNEIEHVENDSGENEIVEDGNVGGNDIKHLEHTTNKGLTENNEADESQEVENEDEQSDQEADEENESDSDQEMVNSADADRSNATDEMCEEDQEEMKVDDDQDEDSDNGGDVISEEVIEESPNVTHDTTGRNRQKVKSPEVILHDKTNQQHSFTAKGRNTSIRKTKSVYKDLNIRPSLAPQRDSIGLSDGTKDSSAEGSGWDSHRTTRKTLRQTFGKDFSIRKSLRALVMEKSAKQTEQTLISETAKFPQANSTEYPEDSNRVDDDNVTIESDHEVSRRTRQTTLETYLEKIKQKNIEKKMQMEQAIRNSLKTAPSRDMNLFKVPSQPPRRKLKPAANKPKKQIKSAILLDDLPSEVVQDMKYKPPKRFQPANASWITKRLYKFLEGKLEPKYDYKARVRAEKLVETIYSFAKDLRRHNVAPAHSVDMLKLELARLDIVKTHFEFYEFFHEFMPREVRVKVVPDIVNNIPLPRHGVFVDILKGNSVQG